MNLEFSNLLKHKSVNGWGLFCVFSIPMCLANYLVMLDTDTGSPEGISHMIGYSVRWAVPFIYLVVAALIDKSTIRRSIFSLVDA